jgi:hypothetical protein
MLAGALVLAASLQQQAVPPSMVRVHFTTPGNKSQAQLWARRAGDSNYSLVCNSPCKADMPGGTPLRATMTDHEDEPYDFVLSNDLGSEVEVIARRGGRGALAGGIVMTSIGGLTAVIGILLAAVSLADINNQAAFRTAGLVCIGIGGGLTVGGITLITGRTYEPVVKQQHFDNSRWATVQSPVAIVPTAALPAVTTPLSFTVSF